MEATSRNDASSERFRFSLRTLVIAVGAICVLLVSYHAFGVSAITFWCALSIPVGIHFWVSKRHPLLGNLLVLITVFGGLLPFLIFTHADPIAQHSLYECQNNLKYSGTATQLYEGQYKTYPTNRRDGNQQPLLSWRVGILPFTEQERLYRSFDRNKAWNVAPNAGLENNRPFFFHCPVDRSAGQTETNYVGIAGDDTMWPKDAAPLQVQDVADGISNTLLIVETHGSGITWTEPRDLNYDALSAKSSPRVSSLHGWRTDYLDGSSVVSWPSQVNAVFADGSTRRLSSDIDPEVLKQLANRRDGKPND